MAVFSTLSTHMGLLRLGLFTLYLSSHLTVSFAGGDRNKDSSCRTIPGDESWPTDDAWAAFNTSVGGRLIRTIPIASVCHGSDYEEDKCNELRDHWFLAETHLSSPSSPMAYEATKGGCNPFADWEAPCNLDGLVAYTVNATSVDDFKTTVQFVKTHNLRLVIRNSGHDYLGKSTGAHALGLWTRHLQKIDLVQDFTSDHYSGPAIKVESGVEGGQALAFAHTHGLMVATGNCPTVGVAGGFSQGGGHGLLSSYAGLGADQVLEWEVLTGDGRLLVATPTSNEDLFWALSGGGGGTYGVVVSMTVKAYPDVLTSRAILQAPRLEGTADSMREVLTTFLQALPAAVDAGATVIWALLPVAFVIIPAAAPGLTKDELDALLKPTTDKLDQLDLVYEYTSDEFPDFHTAYEASPHSWNVSDLRPGGRFMPRSLIEDNLSAFVHVAMAIGDQGALAGVSYNHAKHAPPWPVSVSAGLRNALTNVVTGGLINYTEPEGWAAANEVLLNDIVGPLRRLAPDAGAYMSEAHPDEPGWQEQFYGGNYEQLLAVKDKYDPDDVFYTRTGVGSHRWAEEGDGRLCRVKGSDWDHSEL